MVQVGLAPWLAPPAGLAGWAAGRLVSSQKSATGKVA